LGKLALVDGYQRFNDMITWTVVAVIIVLVQLVQLIGNLLARKVMRR
jgi:D-methionine transport system permease protein